MHTDGAPTRAELQATLAVLKAAKGARRFRAIASAGTVDRAGDIVEPSGWRLESYRKNPVILVSHDSQGLPVARATHIAVEGRALAIEGQFPPAGTSARADEAWDLIEAGILGAVSVGFLPLKAEPRRDGMGWRYLEQDLLEVSLVSVPANPDALIQPSLAPSGRAAGEEAPPGPPAVHRALPRLAARRRQLSVLQTEAGTRKAGRAVELAELRRQAAPERAAKVAMKARAAGKPRLAAAAAELAKVRP